MPRCLVGQDGQRRAVKPAQRTRVLGQCFLRAVGHCVHILLQQHSSCDLLNPQQNAGVAAPAAVLLTLSDKQHRKNRDWRERLKERREINLSPCWQTATLPSPCQIATSSHEGLLSFLLLLPCSESLLQTLSYLFC